MSASLVLGYLYFLVIKKNKMWIDVIVTYLAHDQGIEVQILCPHNLRL